MTPEKENAPGQEGRGQSTSDTREHTAGTSAVPACKPEIDLGSWAALGKASRDCRQKKAWHRQRGGIDAGLAAHLLMLAVALGLLVVQFTEWLQ